MELQQKRIAVALVLCMLIVLMAVRVFGVSGATISNNTTEAGPVQSVGDHTANRSTITTLLLSSTQQDQNWKGYVGNVTGGLTLDDAASQTLYDWTLTSFTGEVYATRASSVGFGSVSCVQTSSMAAENTFFNMTSAQIDSINRTFDVLGHSPFQVGTTPFPADNCLSIATYVSDTPVAASSAAAFQEILIEDGSNNLIFVSLINDDTNGFDDNDYDFQMIVPESDVNATRATYYFYLELGS